MENNEQAAGQTADFEAVKNRLAEIAEAVDDEALSLDEALDLYEEAVAIGLRASDLLEVGIVPPEETPGEDEADEGEAGDVGDTGAASGAAGSAAPDESDTAAISANSPEPSAPSTPSTGNAGTD